MRGMERCAHRDQVQTLDTVEDFRVCELRGQRYRSVVVYASAQGVAYGARLLMNFFEHEVWIAFLLRHVGRPRNRLGRTAHAMAVQVSDLNSGMIDDCD